MAGNNNVLPLLLVAIISSVVGVVAAVAAIEVRTADASAPVTTADAKGKEIDRLQTRVDDLQDALNANVAALEALRQQRTLIGDGEVKPVDKDITVEDFNDLVAAVNALNTRIAEMQTQIDSDAQALADYKAGEAERHEQNNRSQMEGMVSGFRDQAQNWMSQMREREDTRLREELGMSDAQIEGLGVINGDLQTKAGELWNKLRAGEMTQEEATAEFERMIEDAEIEQSRLLSTDQMDGYKNSRSNMVNNMRRMSEMQRRMGEGGNGEGGNGGGWDRFLPGGGNGE